jgi:PleD family two-component response regulator
VLLPGSGPLDARERIEALQARLARTDLQWQPLPFSGGVASSKDGAQSADGLLSLADEALIRARAQGGDRVEASDSGDEVEAPEGRETLAVPDGVGLLLSTATTTDASARIVVIDDDRANLRAFERSLSTLGFQTISPFSDPEAALAHIEREGVDLVLLDLHMEPLDGFGVLRRLGPTFDREGFLPVIVLTGERDPKVRERALRMGGRDFLTKPIDRSELHVRILNLLETRTLHRQVRAAATSLEDRVRARTRELEEARADILSRLARARESPARAFPPKDGSSPWPTPSIP